MKQSKFTEEQIIAILRQAEQGDATIATVCRAHGVSENTFYKWRQKYGGADVSAVKRLRELEQENARLKRLVAEQALAQEALKELLAKRGPQLPSGGSW